MAAMGMGRAGVESQILRVGDNMSETRAIKSASAKECCHVKRKEKKSLPWGRAERAVIRGF